VNFLYSLSGCGRGSVVLFLFAPLIIDLARVVFDNNTRSFEHWPLDLIQLTIACTIYVPIRL